MPVGSSSVQLASGPGFTPSVIGITQVTLANTVVSPGVPTVQTTGGRTSPLIVMAPNQLQQFGAQIIMLPSPNQITASPQTSVVEATGVQAHTVPQPPAETNIESANNTDAAAESCTALNTISLPETSSCSPDGEALLEKLDKMDTSSVIEISPLENQPENTEAVDLHELTAYLTHGEEASVTTTSTHSDTITSQTSATLTSSLDTVVTTTVVSSERSAENIDTVTRSLGFNPISPAEAENMDKTKTMDSLQNLGSSEEQKQDTNVEMPDSDKLSQAVSSSANSRPSSREGMHPSVSLHEGRRSRPNSRGTSYSPSTKQGGGFVQLGEHTRDSPNIFVSIQSAMPLTGKHFHNF